ncbi:hypothetical protein [Antarctobacter sp.]|uniref:hypothetical protein n=1 Tax=Antarctobacter sp. TaxID=1872577 RepID=UPI002B264BC0|nr:hypothetical protein [Antarctobacter sp.]
MIRSIDPLFPAILFRIGGKFRANQVAARIDTTPTAASKVRTDDRPEWDAPAHWIEPERHW